MKPLLLSTIVLSLFLGCTQPTSLEIKKDKLIHTIEGEYDEPKTPTVYRVYQDSKQRFYIWKNRKALYRDLKFVQPLDVNSSNLYTYQLQVLDKNNKKKILTLNSKVKAYRNYPCGVGARNMMFSSKKMNNGFFLTLTSEETLGVDTKLEFSEIIAHTKNTDALLFANLKSSYKFNTMDSFFRKIKLQEYIIIDKTDEKYKLLGKIKFIWEKKKYQFEKFDNSTLYENISNIHDVLVLQKDSLVGYYTVSDIKYKSLEPFDLYLARFELPNGRKGYIDTKGNEYFDKE